MIDLPASTVLEPDAALPRVAHVPAPWQLSASAYVLAVRMPEELFEHDAFVPPGLASRRRSAIAYVLYIDYQSSDVGPYRELLLAPASYDFGDGCYPTITRIFVSSYESVVNGRNNWGIPKDRAEFAVQRSAQQVDEIHAAWRGQPFAELRLRSFGPSLPVTSSLLPARMLTLTQHWQGKSYRFTLRARGVARLARLLGWRFDPRFFPDLARGKLLAAVHLPRFEMTFPAAHVTQLARGS